MPYCRKCSKELILKEGPMELEDPFYDFTSGKKMQHVYRKYTCPEFNKNPVWFVAHTNITEYLGDQEVE
jgi:hypothetical protein